MEFHNILDFARGESKLRENSTLECPNFQMKAFGEETRNETTKNRAQHDQGSLNKRSASSVFFFLLLHWLFTNGASGENTFRLHPYDYPRLVWRNCLKQSKSWNSTPIAAI